MSTTVHVLCGLDANYLLPAAGHDPLHGRRPRRRVTVARRTWSVSASMLTGGCGSSRPPPTPGCGCAGTRSTRRWWAGCPCHERAYLTESVYLRLFLDRFLPPEVERVLFIDVDTVVCRSVAELFAVDLGDAAIAAVRDSEHHAVRPERRGRLARPGPRRARPLPQRGRPRDRPAALARGRPRAPDARLPPHPCRPARPQRPGGAQRRPRRRLARAPHVVERAGARAPERVRGADGADPLLRSRGRAARGA